MRHVRGLHGKFFVIRVDGRDGAGEKHDGCRYFVLDLDHDEAATAALSAYRDAVLVTRPALAEDISRMLGGESA